MHKKHFLYIIAFIIGSNLIHGMSKSGDLPVDEFARRRAIFIDELRDLNACAILHAAPEHMRNMAVNFGYRQDSDFIYLSGWSQANAILLLTPKADDTEAAEVTLFVSPRNPKYEVWTGPKKGLDEARELPGIDQIFDSDDFFEKYQKLITGYERLVVSYGNDAEFQAELNSSMEKSRQHPSIIQEASSLIKFHRLIKSESEIQAIEKAIHITGESLKEVFPQIPNLSFEYEVRAEIERGFTKRGAVRLGFLSIVGAGKNATYLHYEEYTGKIEQGDLILMDVGAEWNYYSADISRTVPINGVFNAEQAIIYQLVLDAQTAGIESIKPGVAFREPHNIAVEIVTQGLVELGLLDGDPKKLIEDEAYRKFFMHGTSHWLGLDVHDAGSSVDAAGDPHILKPGMILTVEPGIYISETEDVDSKWWNIGVRIEDDVLVTAKGYRLLSASIPRSINQIEALMQP